MPLGKIGGQRSKVHSLIARVAVLLVTKNFLILSRFITEKELPVLLLTRAPGRISSSLSGSLSGFPDMKPLNWLRFRRQTIRVDPLKVSPVHNATRRLFLWQNRSQDAATMSTLAGGLQIIDETTEPLEASLYKRPEKQVRSFGIQAYYESRDNKIAFKGTTTVISANDLDRLPNQDREFIANLEDSLERNYKRWSDLRKRLGAAMGALDGEIEQQLSGVEKLMCQDLTIILDFLRQMHKVKLEDHYLRYRYICQQLHGGQSRLTPA